MDAADRHNEIALGDAIAGVITEQEEFRPFLAYVEECAVWGLRCHLARSDNALLHVFETLVTVYPIRLRVLAQAFNGNEDRLHAALVSLQAIVKDWVAAGERNGAPTFPDSERFVAPPNPLCRGSFKAVDGAVRYSLRAIARDRKVKSSASRRFAGSNWVVFAGLNWVVLGTAVAATAAAIGGLLLLEKYLNVPSPSAPPKQEEQQKDKASSALPSQALTGPISVGQNEPDPRKGADTSVAASSIGIQGGYDEADFLAVYMNDVNLTAEILLGVEPCGKVGSVYIYYPSNVSIPELARAAGKLASVKGTAVYRAGVDFEPMKRFSKESQQPRGCYNSYTHKNSMGPTYGATRELPPAIRPLTHRMSYSVATFVTIIDHLQQLPVPVQVCGHRDFAAEAERGRNSLDPRERALTGMRLAFEPGEWGGGTVGVVVRGPIYTDALSTSGFPMGPEEAREYDGKCMSVENYFGAGGPGYAVLNEAIRSQKSK